MRPTTIQPMRKLIKLAHQQIGQGVEGGEIDVIV